jgi:hypothetical protein
MAQDGFSSRPQKPVAAPQPKDHDDFRWLLDHATDRAALDPFYKGILEKLDKSIVPTAVKAEEKALEYKLKSEGLDAREGWKVIGLLRMGVTVPEFAESGDLIWAVRFSMPSWGLRQEMWISSTTGAIRTMLPVKKQPNMKGPSMMPQKSAGKAMTASP